MEMGIQKKCSFDPFFEHAALTFITSELLLAKQGRNLAWAPSKDRVTVLMSFIESWPTEHLFLLFSHSLAVPLSVCTVWGGFGFVVIVVLFFFSALYFSGAQLEIFWHLAQWYKFFIFLGEEISLLVTAHQSASPAPRWWPSHPILACFNIILTPIFFHCPLNHSNWIMISIISSWNTTNFLVPFIGPHPVF